jgi:hypothetical protein
LWLCHNDILHVVQNDIRRLLAANGGGGESRRGSTCCNRFCHPFHGLHHIFVHNRGCARFAGLPLPEVFHPQSGLKIPLAALAGKDYNFVFRQLGASFKLELIL